DPFGSGVRLARQLRRARPAVGLDPVQDRLGRDRRLETETAPTGDDVSALPLSSPSGLSRGPMGQPHDRWTMARSRDFTPTIAPDTTIGSRDKPESDGGISGSLCAPPAPPTFITCLNWPSCPAPASRACPKTPKL